MAARVSLSTQAFQSSIVCQRLVQRCDRPGRTAACEILVASDAIRDTIRDTKKAGNMVSLQEQGESDLPDFEAPLEKTPYVIMVVGVNGVGKTTTIGKLAYQFKQKGMKVVIGAGDTFRAAAMAVAGVRLHAGQRNAGFRRGARGPGLH